MIELESLATEQRNPHSQQIDRLSTEAMLQVINDEDHKVAEAIKEIIPAIARAVDVISDRLRQGGRLFYVGSGTSGRLGILDAVECPPTYSTDPEQIQGLIAGGYDAIFRAKEGAEDSSDLGQADLREKKAYRPRRRRRPQRLRQNALCRRRPDLCQKYRCRCHCH